MIMFEDELLHKGLAQGLTLSSCFAAALGFNHILVMSTLFIQLQNETAHMCSPNPFVLSPFLCAID